MRLHVYGYDGCPWCRKAKELLEKEGVSFTYLVAGETKEERAAWLDQSGIQGKDRTFPRIFQIDRLGDEVLVGGYEDLETLLLFGKAA